MLSNYLLTNSIVAKFWIRRWQVATLVHGKRKCFPVWLKLRLLRINRLFPIRFLVAISEHFIFLTYCHHSGSIYYNLSFLDSINNILLMAKKWSNEMVKEYNVSARYLHEDSILLYTMSIKISMNLNIISYSILNFFM